MNDRLIDIEHLEKGFKLLNHNLINTWSWSKLHRILDVVDKNDDQQYFSFKNDGFILYRDCLKHDDVCNQVLKFIGDLDEKLETTVNLYASLKNNSSTFPYHFDEGQYLFIWQVIGNTLWIVEGKRFILKENQLLYISKNLMHGCIPNEPRVSLSFSLE